MRQFTIQLRQPRLTRSLLTLALAAACGVPAAFAGNGGGGSPIVGIAITAAGKKIQAPTLTPTIIPNQVDKPGEDTPPNGTDDGLGGLAEACAALPFLFDFAVLQGIQREAEYAHAYVAGRVGVYNRAAYDSALLFLMHYDALVNYTALIDVDVPWASDADDSADGSATVSTTDSGLDSGGGDSAAG